MLCHLFKIHLWLTNINYLRITGYLLVPVIWTLHSQYQSVAAFVFWFLWTISKIFQGFPGRQSRYGCSGGHAANAWNGIWKFVRSAIGSTQYWMPSLPNDMLFIFPVRCFTIIKFDELVFVCNFLYAAVLFTAPSRNLVYNGRFYIPVHL